MNETYRILQKLGKGGTSNVYLGYHNNLNTYIVIKQLKGENADETLSQAEVNVLKELRHQYLPRVYDYPRIYNAQKNCFDVYTVMDYIDGATLLECLRSGFPFTEELLKRYLRQMAEVLVYMHGQTSPVYHCDIKPENIMIDRNGNAILIDFNTAVGGNQNNILGLTPPYASPEQIDLAHGQGGGLALDGRTDIYSLGATFYLLISGRFPSVGEQSQPLHTMGLTGYSSEFLRLIDRMMVFKRENRLKSAKKLLAAIDRLDISYRRYFTARCASVLVSAAFVSFGLFFLIRGTQLKPIETYNGYYTTAVNSIHRGDLELAEEACIQIRKNGQLQKYLQSNSDEQARLYHAMGDICYYREDFGTAVAYYVRAVEICGACTVQERLTFVRDTAIAYAQFGDLSMARAYLAAAKELQPSGADLDLIDIVIAARSGDARLCVEKTEELISTSTDVRICLRAALTAASVCEDPDEKIEWFRLAAGYDAGKTAQRGLAMAWAEKAQTAQDPRVQQEAQTKAMEIFEGLCADAYASAADRINYSILLRSAGQKNQALRELKTASQYEPENYRVLTHLAMLYYELGNNTDARECCESALRLWRADDTAQKLEEGSEEIQYLMEISRRLGIGGVA